MRRSPKWRRGGGFSLVELLVAVAIMVLLSSVSIPAMLSWKRASDLGIAAASLTDALRAGQQASRTLNRQVQVRFYYPSGGTSPTGVQLYPLDFDGSSHAVRKKFLIPVTVAVSADATLSSLLPLLDAATDDGATYRALTFLAGGKPKLSPTSASPTLTIVDAKDAAKTQLPSNYVTLQVDPQTGNVTVYRP